MNTNINFEFEVNGVVEDQGFSKIKIPVLLGTKIPGFGTIFIALAF